MISLDTVSTSYEGAVIKVIGIGGGGGNAINNMITKGLSGVEFIAANTDRQALEHNLAHVKVQVGKNSTKGLGAGANPEVGKSSIEESRDAIKQALQGSDMIFVTSGMGGGTGTGGAPLVAQIGQELGALVVAIVTKPFQWEGSKRMKLAEQWIEELRNHVDALIVISNQRLLEIIDKNTSFAAAFSMVDEVLYNATKGIADIISNHGVVNVDFADISTIMKGKGDSIMGIGRASGENRAIEATKAALNSPILDGVSIAGAKGLLVNITGNMTMFEISEAVSLVQEAAGDDALLIHGVVPNTEMGDEIMVTVVATGLNQPKEIIAPKVEEVKIEETPAINNTNAFSNQNSRIGQLTFGGASSNRFSNSQVATALDMSPKGPNQLRNLDEAAIIRKGNVNQAPLGGQHSAQIEKLRESAIGIGEKSNKILNSEPAFLRKIMD